MIAKCWNCHTEFEVLGSPRDSNKLTAQSIAEVLRSNMFDAQRGGTIIMNVDDMVDEIAEIIAEYLND